jgi:hypothetical protein
MSTQELVEADSNRQTMALGSVALLLALVVVSLIVIRNLRRQVELQDCMMVGMTHCEVVIASR